MKISKRSYGLSFQALSRLFLRSYKPPNFLCIRCDYFVNDRKPRINVPLNFWTEFDQQNNFCQDI